MEDEHRIAGLLIRWGHARDSDDWGTLSECFHEDATIHISRMSGSAKEFVARSRVMAAVRKAGTHMKHLICRIWVKLNRYRAFSRCNVNLQIRGKVRGHEFDLHSWFRFFDLLKRENDSWRITRRTAVYEKDCMFPVWPGGFPEDFFSDMELSRYPAPAKFLCYWIRCCGGSGSTDIISVHSEEEHALKKESEAWLRNA